MENRKRSEVLALVQKVGTIDKCKKCDCMRGTLRSMHDALRESGASGSIELLAGIEETLDGLLSTEYT